jgi:hypothetical protein
LGRTGLSKKELRRVEVMGRVKARSLEVSRQELYRWSRDVDKFGERAFPGVGQKRIEETRIAELERKIGQQVLEIDFLKRALQHVEQPRQLRVASGGAPFTNRSSAK